MSTITPFNSMLARTGRAYTARLTRHLCISSSVNWPIVKELQGATQFNFHHEPPADPPCMDFSRPVMRQLTQQVSDYVVGMYEDLDHDRPSAASLITPCPTDAELLPGPGMHGAGYDWLLDDEPDEDHERAKKLANIINVAAPEAPTEPNKVVDFVFKHTVPYSMDTLNGGFMGWIPSGGLFPAALADFIGASVNRFTAMHMTAPAIAEMEQTVSRWFAKEIGYTSPLAGGVLTSGGSAANLAALCVARDQCCPKIADLPRAMVYVTAHSHYSVNQSARVVGFPDDNVRSVPVLPDTFQMDLAALRRMIEADLRAGNFPACIVGAGGTTGVGAVDDLRALGVMAKEYGAWFHVDAAAGGFFILCDQGKRVLDGIHTADSVTMDPHKGLSLPYSTGSLVVPDMSMLTNSFAHHRVAYLADASHEVDVRNLSPELSRRARGLRVWMTVQMLGMDAFRKHSQHKMDLAKWAANEAAAIPGVQLVNQPMLSTFAIRWVPPRGTFCSRAELNARNADFNRLINSTGDVLMTPLTTLTGAQGEFCTRMCVMSSRTTAKHVQKALARVQEAAQEVTLMFRNRDPAGDYYHAMPGQKHVARSIS